MGAPKSSSNDCVAIVGLGYVGLPLAAAFGAAGFEVIGFDVNAQKITEINAGRSVSPDVPDATVAALVDAGKLRATDDFSEAQHAGLISICVPTPLRKSKDPDISYIVDACGALVPYVRPGTVVVLESTTYPGTTREIIQPHFEAAGFTIGKDLHLAFSPERIDPGNETWTITNTPKIVGGLTPDCGERARAYYERAIDEVIVVRDAETAEMSKLLENTFRSVNIGLVNELSLVCQRLGVSTFDVIDAASTKPFGYMRFEPGPGLGGHCLPIDPLYLSWKMRMLDYKVRFIDLADDVNSGMPMFVVRRGIDVLNQQGKSAKGSSILIVGLAYKGGVDDVRESPAVDLFEGFRDLGANVDFYDPHVSSFRSRGETFTSVGLEETQRDSWDLIVIATSHPGVDHDGLADMGIPILDTRNALKGRRDAHVFSL